MARTSHYDKTKADFAVNFIECLTHTQGIWAGKKFELIDWQEKIIRDLFGTIKANGYRQFNTAYIEIPKKNGKQLALDTKIPTPEGFKTMGNLQVGDRVFDERGQICRVVAKSEIDDTEQAYRLTFRDGSSIIAGERHLWNVEYIYGKTKAVVWTTGEIYRRLMKFRKKYRDNLIEGRRSIIRISVTKPLDLPEKDLPVDPYLYGYWLGNGAATKPNITIRDSDVEEIISLIPYKVRNRYPQKSGGSEVVYYDELKKILVPSFRDKVIRPEYLRASEKQRWELLQGLTDSDGCISTSKAQSIYVSTIKQLADSVRELLWSLGIKNAMHESPSTRYGAPTGETLYTIRFTTFDNQPTSKLRRKIVRSRQRLKETRSCFHYLENIEPLKKRVKMQCIQVDSESHCYLAGESFIPTHNSELAAAVALLLLCGDGEERAEVYGCAADRQQASIVFNVAADMVRMCPALAKRMKILDSYKRLIFLPTNSFYQVLSAEAFSKHGFNISGVIFDELHTQPDRRLFDVMTKGSGDARTQPLYFLITTAGTDTNSICYEQHQKAVDIIEGRKHDATFYPCIFGAAQED
ncbi:MAG: terminase, partial [Selenomonadaceae bacterium]|nr:terminase [Selenomonadaceae bacterium]